MFQFQRPFFVAVSCIAALCPFGTSFADDELLPKSDVVPSELPFPVNVRLLGYIQQTGSTAVLIEIGNETYILKKDVEENVSLPGAPDANLLVFRAINFDNRSITLGFPKSPYLPKTCRMSDRLVD